MRRFSDLTMGNINLADKLLLPLTEGTAWFFHGDIFDASIQSAKWLAKFGGWSYDLLIRINSILNWLLRKLGKEPYSFSKKIKNSVKKAVTYIQSFEDAAAERAIQQGYKYVICGHIHQPQLRAINNEKCSCFYLNSGDWIENLTALEYNEGLWDLYQHEKVVTAEEEEEAEQEELLNDLNLERILKKVLANEEGIRI